MRIIQLIPGAGNTFYCENCLRDNALAKTLLRRNHEVMITPLYLPILADECNGHIASPVFFGGINVFLQQKFRIFRQTPRWVDRLFDARPLMKWAAGMTGMTRASDLAETTLSMLQGESGRQAKELHRLVEWLYSGPKPDIIHLSNALLSGMAPALKKDLNIPIVCSLQDEDIFINPLPDPQNTVIWDQISSNAESVDAFISVSEFYKQRMHERLRIPAERISVIPNAIFTEDFKPRQHSPDPPVIGYLERQCSEKGLHVLIEAFILLKKRNRLPGLKCRIAGGKTADDEAYIRMLRRRIRETGIEGDVEFLHNLIRPEKLDFLNSLTVFSVPAVHEEAFGMYILEALAAGVPVVQPRHGAFPEILDATGGGVLCEPDDAEDLSLALEELLLHPDRANALGQRGRSAVLERYGMEKMVDAYLKVYEVAAAS